MIMNRLMDEVKREPQRTMLFADNIVICDLSTVFIINVARKW